MFENIFIIESSQYNDLILYRKYKLSKWANKVKRLGLIGGFALVLIGCSSFSNLKEVGGYDSQKRIVWQGTLTVQLGEDIFRMIYFGYDRNGGMHRLTKESICRGVDLLEYKGLLPNGHWVFYPIMILSDDNFDCYADRVLYDCDADGNFEKVANIPEGTVRLEFIDDAHRNLIDSNCLKSWRAH
jgi:hypothetical protein